MVVVELSVCTFCLLSALYRAESPPADGTVPVLVLEIELVVGLVVAELAPIMGRFPFSAVLGARLAVARLPEKVVGPFVVLEPFGADLDRPGEVRPFAGSLAFKGVDHQ